MNTRRTVMKSAAWTVPAIAIAAPAPAYATSQGTNKVRCYWKEPGKGQNNNNSYYVSGENIAGVVFSIDDGTIIAGAHLMSNEGGYAWGIQGLDNARSPMNAVVTFNNGKAETLRGLFLPYAAACKA